MINAKLVLFGDSIGKGIVTEASERAVTSANAVSLFEKKYSVTIDNRSKFGQTVAKCVQRQEIEKFLDTLDGSVKTAVIIELGGNDCAYFWEKVAEDPDVKHDSVTPFNEFIDYYQKMLSLLVTSGVPVFCCSLVPINARKYLENVIGKICDKEKILKYFDGDYTVIYRHHETYSNAIKSICYASCIPVIDLRETFEKTGDVDAYLCEDGIHPNERGQRLIFGKVCEFAEGYLK